MVKLMLIGAEHYCCSKRSIHPRRSYYLKALHVTYMFQWKDDLVHENTTGYLKNHWTKHRLVCTHFDDAFSMLIPNMDTVFQNYQNYEHFLKNVTDTAKDCTRQPHLER